MKNEILQRSVLDMNGITMIHTFNERKTYSQKKFKEEFFYASSKNVEFNWIENCLEATISQTFGYLGLSDPTKRRTLAFFLLILLLLLALSTLVGIVIFKVEIPGQCQQNCENGSLKSTMLVLFVLRACMSFFIMIVPKYDSIVENTWGFLCIIGLDQVHDTASRSIWFHRPVFVLHFLVILFSESYSLMVNTNSFNHKHLDGLVLMSFFYAFPTMSFVYFSQRTEELLSYGILAKSAQEIMVNSFKTESIWNIEKLEEVRQLHQKFLNFNKSFDKKWNKFLFLAFSYYFLGGTFELYSVLAIPSDTITTVENSVFLILNFLIFLIMSRVLIGVNSGFGNLWNIIYEATSRQKDATFLMQVGKLN